jgi:hypothetical protein
MRIVLSNLVAQAKGRLGNFVLQNSKFGMIARNFVYPSLSISPANVLNRLNYSQFVARWNALSASDKAAWLSAALTYSWHSSTGVSYAPSGFQLFLYCSINLASVGISTIPVAANYVSIPQPGSTMGFLSEHLTDFEIISCTNRTSSYKVQFAISFSYASAKNIALLPYINFYSLAIATTLPHNIYSNIPPGVLNSFAPYLSFAVASRMVNVSTGNAGSWQFQQCVQEN